MLLLAFLILPCYCANILGVFPNTGKSHHTLGEVILKKLAAKGHHVTMMSKFPQKNKIANFTDIDLWEIENEEEFIKTLAKSSILQVIAIHLKTTINETEVVFKNKGVKRLLSGSHAFDLILMDFSSNYAHLIFGEIYNAPIILISSFGSSVFTNWIIGNPQPYAYVPHMLQPYTAEMNFFERFYNTFDTISMQLLMTYGIKMHEDLIRKHFNISTTSEKLKDRVQLIFANNVWAVSNVQANVPNLINIGGIHVEESKKLPESLESFLNNSKNGFVYFSLGTNMKSVYLSEDVIQMFVRSFSKLDMNVLWKYEGDSVPNKPGNVKLMKWVPQNDVLGHPNVRLFVTHGGLLSVIEAVHHAVPIVGVPMFGDQKANVPRAVKHGYALQLDVDDISEEKITSVLREALKNPKYKKEVLRRSVLMKDRLVHPLDEAVFWVEHVLRHGNADHLRNAAANMPFYKYFLLDVIAVSFLIIFVPVAVLFYFVKKLLKKKTKKD